MKLTKTEFDSLYDGDISKKKYDSIIANIDERFSDVVMLIHPTITKNGWFVYGNYDPYDSENDEGEFVLGDYKTEITIGGECEFPEPYCFTDEGNGYIPTRWLWTDDKDILSEFNKEVEKAKNEKIKEKLTAKEKREELKIRKEQFKQIISSKLTKEELKYITFK